MRPAGPLIGYCDDYCDDMLSWLMAAAVTAASPPPEPGVSMALARSRASNIQDVRYDVAFRVPVDRSRRVEGVVTIRFALTAPVPLVLDFAQPADHVRGIRVGGRPVTGTVAGGHIVLPGDVMVRGENAVTIDFVSGDDALNRGDDLLYTLFVPARAHLAFPCFDQPDIKARYTLSVTVPVGWQVAANGRQVGEEETPAQPGYVTHRFAETRPLSTYLFAFAAGRFSVETAVRGGRQMRMFHRETDPAKVARNRDVIFDLHAGALAWLEDYTAIPYPFETFDFVLVPSFQFGGMEHAGAVFYNASSLMLDESATQNQLLGRASLIAHETSHMWFGDLVTMRWFNDVWTKEVFANFMAAKIVNPSFPQLNHELRFLLDHYPAAYQVDRTRRQQSHPADAGQPERGRPDVRPHHLRQGAGGDAAAGADGGRVRLPRRPARLSPALQVRQRYVAGTHRHSRRAHAARPGGLEPRLGRGTRSPVVRGNPAIKRRANRQSRADAAGHAGPWPRLAAAAADHAGL